MTSFKALCIVVACGALGCTAAHSARAADSSKSFIKPVGKGAPVRTPAPPVAPAATVPVPGPASVPVSGTVLGAPGAPAGARALTLVPGSPSIPVAGGIAGAPGTPAPMLPGPISVPAPTSISGTVPAPAPAPPVPGSIRGAPGAASPDPPAPVPVPTPRVALPNNGRPLPRTVGDVISRMQPALAEAYVVAHAGAARDGGAAMRAWLARAPQLDDRSRNLLELDMVNALIVKIDKVCRASASGPNQLGFPRGQTAAAKAKRLTRLNDAEELLRGVHDRAARDPALQAMASEELALVTELKKWVAGAPIADSVGSDSAPAPPPAEEP